MYQRHSRVKKNDRKITVVDSNSFVGKMPRLAVLAAAAVLVATTRTIANKKMFAAIKHTSLLRRLARSQFRTGRVAVALGHCRTVQGYAHGQERDFPPDVLTCFQEVDRKFSSWHRWQMQLARPSVNTKTCSRQMCLRSLRRQSFYLKLYWPTR